MLITGFKTLHSPTISSSIVQMYEFLFALHILKAKRCTEAFPCLENVLYEISVSPKNEFTQFQSFN